MACYTYEVDFAGEGRKNDKTFYAPGDERYSLEQILRIAKEYASGSGMRVVEVTEVKREHTVIFSTPSQEE